jgi:ubiquinone biosynthesis protein
MADNAAMLSDALHAIRDLPRLHEIASVLIRHGFGDLVGRAGITGALERAGQALRKTPSEPVLKLSAAARARLALAELGPTFVKLGQVLATRVDLLPPEWIAEFERLQSEVPPVPFETLLPQLEEALGASPLTLFRDVQPTPLGSASIAQVHAASLQDGTPVVLKVMRPGIRPKIEADVRLLGGIAALMEAEMPEVRRFQPVRMVAEFSRSIQRELDLSLEARSQQRFAENFAGDPHVVIPRIYWDYTRHNVNVQERIEGVPGTDLAGVDAAGLDRRELARRGADAVLKMILEHGYFHADPHPGNVFYLPGNRLALIDFGMVGRLTAERRRQIVDMLSGLTQRDEGDVVEVLLEWVRDGEVDEKHLASDIAELIFDYDSLPLKDIRLAALLQEVAAIVRRHSIVLPSDLAMLFKALISLEGLGRRLDPEFQLVSHMTPFLQRLITRRYRPRALLQSGRQHLLELASMAGRAPRDLRQLIKSVRRGHFKLEMDLKRLDRFGHQLDRSANRLTVGIVTAALIVGSSIVMTVQGGPTIFGLPLFGFLGFTLAFLGGVWLLLSIWRSGRG